MKTTDQLHEELIVTTEKLQRLLETAGDLQGSARANLEHWKEICARSGRTLIERQMRVAAIGAIKSGKSTLVNALLGGDYLRRGAGVVTSIVTRVRRAALLRARLFFKSWEAINNEIRQALVLFPDGNHGDLDTTEFDLRKQAHRESLSRKLAELPTDQLIRTDMRDPNSVLLAAYLKGYPLAAPLIDDQERQQAYTGEQFRRHQGFVGDDALSVYLKDVQLEIPASYWDESVEIADCQGSDSPNPHHLAMIQDYLTSAHLMLYVVSSRTGLRQADMKFLSMLKKMGSMDNILFVVNCDLSEHENLADLERVVLRTQEDLQPLRATPEIFAFSALYHLFNLPDMELNAKAQGRLSAWQVDSEMTSFVEAQLEAFRRRLQYKLSIEGFSIQAGAHLGRLDAVLGGFVQWLELNKRLLAQDEAAAQALRARLQEHQTRMQRNQPVLKTALLGAVEEIKSELRIAVDRFFDAHSGEAVKELMAVVTDPPVDPEKYVQDIHAGGFGDALYRLLQAYRQSVDTVMAERLNPAIIRFIREAENRLVQMLEEICGPHAEMVQQAVSDYHQALAGEGAPPEAGVPAAAMQVDLDSLRRELKLQLPKAQATLDYSLQMRSEAFVRLGMDRFVNWIRRLLRRENRPADGKGLAALKGALKRMRREMEASIRSHLLNHRENIKFQYLLKLADAAGEGLYRQLSELYSMQVADLAELEDPASRADSDLAGLSEQIAILAQSATSLEARLNDHREELEALGRSYRSER